MVVRAKGRVPIELLVAWLAAHTGMAPSEVWNLTFAEFALRLREARKAA